MVQALFPLSEATTPCPPIRLQGDRRQTPLFDTPPED
jgi:hypothetical protein